MFDGPRDGVFEAEGKEAMVFQEKTWSWGRIAVRLMLVPILAGGSVATAQGPSTTSGPLGAPTNQMRPPAGKPQANGGPQALLKEGRKALAENRFNDARDLAQRAEASNPTGKWGLFDDTPNSLRKDIETAQAKAQKAESEQLTKKAKDLFNKPASDAEKAANINTALQMAKRADQLHGPYSVWEFGDRPDKLVKEIEAARAKLRPMQPAPSRVGTTNRNTSVASTVPPPGAPGTGVRPVVGSSNPAAPGAPSMVASAAGTGMTGAAQPLPSGPLPPPPGSSAQLGPVAPVAPGAPSGSASDPKKIAAQKLLNEGKQLADNGDFPGAKAKFQAAAQIGATFGDREYTPGFALQELNTRGAAAINRLVGEAQARMTQKEFAKADAALNAATEIATALSLFTRPIDEARASLRVASGARNGVGPAGGPMPVAGLAPADGPETLVPVPGMPGKPSVAMLPTAPDHTPPGAATGSPVGRQLLDQATAAYKAGDYEVAKKLAIQAHNSGGSQEEARGLLNSIDADVLAAKQRTAVKSFQAAVAAADNKEHSHALQVLVLIDPNYLPSDMKAKREVLLLSCKAEVDKTSSGAPGAAVVAVGGMQVPPDGGNLQPLPMMPPVGGAPAGTARVGGDPKSANPDNLTGQVESMRQVTFQKLRADGLKVQAEAQAAWGRGEPDPAIQMLLEYQNRVKAANLEPASVALLLRPIDTRLDMFTKMKRQADALARERNEKNEAKALIASRGAADEQRKTEVQRLVRQYHELAKKQDFAGAERVALQAKQLDPDDPAVTALALMAKLSRRKDEAQKLASDKEKMVYEGLNAAEREGPFLDTNDPVSVSINAARRARGRGSLDDSYLRTRTPEEYQIDVRLDQPMSVEFNQTPLSEVIETIREKTGLPFSYDTASITAAGISTAMPITEKLPSISTRNVLTLVLEKAGLSFVIEHGVIKVLPVKMVKGRLFTKVFSVADLVTPIPNYALPDYANFDKMFSRNALNNPNVVIDKLNGTSSGSPRGGLGGGTPTGGQPGISGTMWSGQGGSLQNQTDNPLGASASLASDRGTKHEQLIRLITSMVRPYSWDANGNGGPGKLEYFDLGSALVVNQTADVIREVQDLLEALRRLQDLAVAVEVRIISLSESWFERMGVDFSMNINTGGKNQLQFQPQLTTGQFTPQPFVNSIQNKGVTVGLTPAGTFTPDLAVPVQSSSFAYAIPGFGGYPNNPGADGGVSLGLAFLNDIQVYLFMEASQGDRRVNVMQAPKLTLFNGQTATLTVLESQFFVTSVQVFSVNGQVVFVPNNQQFVSNGPIGNATLPAINLSLQAVVSADRRFVRINIPVTLAAQTGSTVPLFPVTTFIIPVFEGGSQGVPVPFTQFLQQPSFTTITVQTTVVCPDGGTVVLGGLKTLGESRNEFGPPFLSDIPYLNRLFKNVGIGRETSHIMIMITPRIIISAEEEITQTEGGGPLGTGLSK